jgi:hypothetical protein
MLQSLRKPQDGTIRIGKESVRDSDYIYNDILLSTQDPFVTRSHCMINYQRFFQPLIPDSLLIFLMGSHSRVGHNSILLNLPQNLFKYILDFLIEPRLPLLISPSSPSFIRVSNHRPRRVHKGMTIAVGAEVMLQVSEVDKENCVIVLLRTGEIMFSFHGGEKAEFAVGRKEFADNGVSEGRISRVQFRVVRKDEGWGIVDGSKEKMTVNGTWVMTGQGAEYLRLKDEIKIGDNVLRIEWER